MTSVRKLLSEYREKKTLVIAYVQGLNQPLQGTVDAITNDYFSIVNTTTGAKAVVIYSSLGCILEVE